MMRYTGIILLGLIGIAGVLHCSQLSLIAGNSSSETTNGYVIGSLVDARGAPAVVTQVRLIPREYDPGRGVQLPDSLIDTTDEAGFYSFIAPAGEFNLEACQIRSGERSLKTGLMVKVGDTIHVPQVKMATPGTILIHLPSAESATQAYVFLPGTTRWVRISSGQARLDSVPAGSIPSVNFADPADTTKNHVIATGLPVSSAATTALGDYTGWKYSRLLTLNTTASGANVAGMVTDFPVLVRLSSANFDFSQAKLDGSDLRFSKSDGTPLPYEIEHWDAIAGSAAVWVKADTVRGNDSVQSFTMRWGNARAASGSNSAVVFDTAAGFQGVWHLAQAGNMIAVDATANHFNGTPSDTAPTPVSGIIGGCQAFNGASNFIRMTGTASSKLNFPENGYYTLSAWAYAETFDSTWHLIAGKGHQQYYMKMEPVTSKSSTWAFVEFHDHLGWQGNTTPAVTRTWKYLVGVRKGPVQYLYLDGEAVDSTYGQTLYDLPRDESEDFTIGSYLRFVTKTRPEGFCRFNGMIDEVRISSGASGADWIKLCYMNQKPNDALVVFTYQ